MYLEKFKTANEEKHMNKTMLVDLEKTSEQKNNFHYYIYNETWS